MPTWFVHQLNNLVKSIYFSPTQELVWEAICRPANKIGTPRLTLTSTHIDGAAKYLLPDWLARGEGYFCSTASAAGLLSQIGSAPYTVTKHAAVAFAEWMSITYGGRGVLVSCLCPQGVNTNMLKGADNSNDGPSGNVVRVAGGVLEPEEVAQACVDTIRAETFLVLPHPEVAQYMALKATERDRWLAGMRKLQKRVLGV